MENFLPYTSSIQMCHQNSPSRKKKKFSFPTPLHAKKPTLRWGFVYKWFIKKKINKHFQGKPVSKAGQERVLSLGKFLKLQGKFNVFKLSHLGVRTILEQKLDNEHESTEPGERTDYKNIQNRPERIWAEISKIIALNLCRFLCISYF